jgi:hypothetical protein
VRSWSVPVRACVAWWPLPYVIRPPPLLFRRRRQREVLPGRNGRGKGSARRGCDGGGRSRLRHTHARRRCGAGTGARAHQRRCAVSLFLSHLPSFLPARNHNAIRTPRICAPRAWIVGPDAGIAFCSFPIVTKKISGVCRSGSFGNQDGENLTSVHRTSFPSATCIAVEFRSPMSGR